MNTQKKPGKNTPFSQLKYLTGFYLTVSILLLYYVDNAISKTQGKQALE